MVKTLSELKAQDTYQKRKAITNNPDKYFKFSRLYIEVATPVQLVELRNLIDKRLNEKPIE